MIKLISRKESTLINQFFKFIADRKLTDAGRKLERLGQTMTEKQWSRGYYNALQGMSLAFKSRDHRYVYISQIDSDDPKKINSVRRKFLEQSRNPLQSDFDKGFFTAWLDYLRFLKKSISKKMTSYNESL